MRERTLCLQIAEAGQSDPRVDKTPVPAGTTLVWEGDPVSTLDVVACGALVGYKLLSDGRRQVVQLLYPGDVVAHHTSPQTPATARMNLEAASPAVVCRYDHAAVMRAAQRDHALSRHLLRGSERELRSTQDLMLSLTRTSARERVAGLLLSLSARAVERGDAPTPIWLPLSRETLGDHLGLTMETTSRVLCGLRRDRTIDHDGHGDWVHLSDTDALRRIANRTPDAAAA